MTITVLNKRTYTGPGQYIGRPSPLGNPFIIGRDGDRNEVINKFRRWLWKEMQSETPARREVLRLARVYREQGRLALVCWCSPDPCHGDVIANAIESILEGDSEWARSTRTILGTSSKGKPST